MTRTHDLRLTVWCAWALIGCHAATPGGVTPERRAAEEAARRAIATEQGFDASSLAPHSVGVPPFDVAIQDTMLSPLGYGLADLLMTDLARSANLQVVDRLRLDAVLQEIRLVEAGRVDTTTGPRVGRLIRARQLVLGGLSQRSAGELAIDARIADVTTGEVRTAVSATAKLEDILRAEKELAFELFDQLNVSLTPAERAAVEQLPTKNVAALLAYSRGVRFQVEGRYEAAAREYRQAVQLDPGFQPAAERLDDVQTPSGPPQTVAAAAAENEAAQSARAADVVTDRLNGVLVSPIGNQQIINPIVGGGLTTLPATIIITISVPE
jgi:TolB-like protein